MTLRRVFGLGIGFAIAGLALWLNGNEYVACTVASILVVRSRQLTGFARNGGSGILHALFTLFV